MMIFFPQKVILSILSSFLKDTDLYVGISTMLLKNDYFKFLDCIEKSDNYIFVTFPFEQESFVDIAEMFRNLHESHMMSK